MFVCPFKRQRDLHIYRSEIQYNCRRRRSHRFWVSEHFSWIFLREQITLQCAVSLVVVVAFIESEIKDAPSFSIECHILLWQVPHGHKQTNKHIQGH